MAAFQIKQGILLNQGVPVREFGVNVPDLLQCWLSSTNPSYVPTSGTPVIYQPNIVSTFQYLQNLGFRIIRFAPFGFYPLQYTTAWINNQATFLAQLDALFALANQYGMLLIPSLFFNSAQIPPAYGENLSAIGNAASQSYAAMQNIVQVFASRYGNNAALAMMEFGNEYDNRIGNNAFFDSLSSTTPDNGQPLNQSLGTPAAWMYPQDTYSTETVLNPMEMFQSTVKGINSTIATMSGNQGLQSVSMQYSQPSFLQLRIAQDVTDTLTSHTYYSNPFYNTDYLNYSQFIAAAKAAAKQAGKPYIIGEYGVPTNYSALSGSSRNYVQQQTRVSTFIADSEIQMALLWNVPASPGTDATYDFSANGARIAELQALANFNAQYRASY